MVYGQTEITKDLMDGRAAVGAPTVYAAHDVGLARYLRRDRPRVTYQRRRHSAGDSPATSSPAATAFTASAARASPAGAITTSRARLPVRLARHPVRHAAGLRRADLCAPSARLRAVLDALADAQPLLPPMQPRRGHRMPGRTSGSGTSSSRGSTTRRASASSPARRSRRASRRCAASSPSRCASAGCSSPATPPISCRRPAPRASISRRATCAISSQALVEHYAEKSDAGLDALFRARAGAGVEGGALFLVDDDDCCTGFRKTRSITKFSSPSSIICSARKAAATAFAENYVGLPY